MGKRFFWFSSHDKAPGRNAQRLQMHHVRDGAALQELSAVLTQAGYEYGGLILNVPGAASRNPIVAGSSYWRGMFNTHDLLVMPTRPALDGPYSRSRGPLLTSGTWPEKQLLQFIQPRVFLECGRKKVALNPALCSGFTEPCFENRAAITFFQYDWPAYKTLRDDPTRRRRDGLGPTAGYFLFIKELWPKGPGCALLFGMSGTATMIWSSLFRNQIVPATYTTTGTVTLPTKNVVLLAEVGRKGSTPNGEGTGSRVALPPTPMTLGEMTLQLTANVILNVDLP